MCLEDLQGEKDEEDLKAYCHEKLVGGLEHFFIFFIFPLILENLEMNFIIPIDEL